MDEPPADEAKTPLGCFLALAIGPFVAGGTAIVFSLLTGRSLGLEWGILALQSLFVSIPFVAVALTGTLRKAPWLVGLALTVILWGYYLFEGVSYQWHPDGTGADIGLGFMMLASPVVITAICLGVHWLQRRNTR
jgi:hypothetical protein